MSCGKDPNENLCKAEARIREAAGRGAQIISVQELFRYPIKGAMFIGKEERYGIIPQMVQGLLDSRKQAKANKSKCKAAGDKDGAEYYDRLQQAIKIMANATYGYFGAKFCQWPYNQFIAPSITAWARDEIQTVVNELEGRGFTVVAGDTDSVFFIVPGHADLDKCKETGFEVQKKFSEGNMHLELEKVMLRFFAHAKKRYFGKIIWPEPSLLVRGYEPRRTDSFDLQSETLTKVFEMVLDGKPDEAVTFAKGTVYDTLKGRVALPKLVISKSVAEFDSYDNNGESLAHVNAARRLKEMGYDFTPGMKMPFIITDASITPQKVEPVIEGVEFAYAPDYKYYAERLAAALSRITEAFGCDERRLMQGNNQCSIDSFADNTTSITSPATSPATSPVTSPATSSVKRVKQASTLDMFM
jgi:DNA polymerase I